MPRVGFEPRIPVFERTKALHALDRAATVIGTVYITTSHCVLTGSDVIQLPEYWELSGG
jgi:hypothetical protein